MSREYWTFVEGLRDGSGNLITGGQYMNNILEQAVTVGAAAVALPTTALSGRRTLTVQNNSANMLYVGSSTVTTSGGILILPKGAITLLVSDRVAVYGIASGAGSDIRILEGS